MASPERNRPESLSVFAVALASTLFGRRRARLSLPDANKNTTKRLIYRQTPLNKQRVMSGYGTALCETAHNYIPRKANVCNIFLKRAKVTGWFMGACGRAAECAADNAGNIGSTRKLREAKMASENEWVEINLSCFTANVNTSQWNKKSVLSNDMRKSCTSYKPQCLYCGRLAPPRGRTVICTSNRAKSLFFKFSRKIWTRISYNDVKAKGRSNAFIFYCTCFFRLISLIL